MSFPDTKIIILPNNQHKVTRISQDPADSATDYKLIDLPHPRHLNSIKYLLHTPIASLYEIKQVKGTNAHLKPSQKLETEFGDAIKSLIVEQDSYAQNAPNEGYVIQDPSVLVATRFNVTYLLITFFVKQQDKRASRFSSLEDIIDSMEQQDNFGNVAHVPVKLIEDGLSHICDFITEGDEKFFKFSQGKTVNFVQLKVTKLAENFPVSILTKFVLPVLTPAEIDREVPQDVLHVAKLKYSFSLISSYLSNDTTSLVSKRYGETKAFAKLEEYLAAQKELRDKKVFAEQSIATMNQQFQNATSGLNIKGKKATTRKTTVTKKTITKKPVKQGRGVLDYFKKKA